MDSPGNDESLLADGAMPDADDLADVRTFLAWARREHFDVRRVRIGDIEVELTDLAVQPPRPARMPDEDRPRSRARNAVAAFAEEAGVPIPDDMKE